MCETAKRFPRLSRWELALTICENLAWEAPNGRPRAHSCLVLLEQMAAAGLVVLPAKAPQAPPRRRAAGAEALTALAIVARLADVRPVTVAPVPAGEQPLWDATMAAQHAQGFRRAFGAHQRYWIHGQFEGQPVILGGLLFAAAARHVACRDVGVGPPATQTLPLPSGGQQPLSDPRGRAGAAVGQPRLGLAPLAPGLARPLRPRTGPGRNVRTGPWRGTCYRAANWVHLGQTTGTGRQDRRDREPGSVKEVFAYPLVANFR